MVLKRVQLEAKPGRKFKVDRVVRVSILRKSPYQAVTYDAALVKT